MAAKYQALQALAKSFIEKIETLDPEAMFTIRTPDCTHHIFPEASIGKPGMSNDEFRATYAPMLRHFRSMRMEVKSVFADPERNVAVVSAQSHAETAGGPYNLEYIYFIHATEDASAIRRIDEFVDSASALEQGGRLREAIKGLEQLDHAKS